MSTVLLSAEDLDRAALQCASVLHQAMSGYSSWAHFQPALRNFVLLTHVPDVLSAPELNVFYTRYFWFSVLALQLRAAHGIDTGVEQQAFQLLEHAPSDVDWSVIAHLGRQASALASKHPRSN